MAAQKINSIQSVVVFLVCRMYLVTLYASCVIAFHVYQKYTAKRNINFQYSEDQELIQHTTSQYRSNNVYFLRICIFMKTEKTNLFASPTKHIWISLEGQITTQKLFITNRWHWKENPCMKCKKSFLQLGKSL